MSPREDLANDSLFPFPDYEQVTYSMWFRTESRGWAAWGCECRSPVTAVADRDACLQRFPDAETMLVRRTERREGLDRNREANLTYGVTP